MKSVNRAVSIGCLLLATLACDGASRNTQPAVSNGKKSTAPEVPRTNSIASLPANLDFSSIDRILQEATPGLNGGVALVLVTGQQVIYRKAFGNYQIDRVLPIASSTKWLSGALVMTLVDEGKISLDDPVSKFLPVFAGDKAAITVRQLFAHTSGLPPEVGCRNNKRTSLDQCANEIAKLPLRAQPGTQFYYGGVSMHVGGRIVEVATGKTWHDAFREKIAAPLGLTATDFYAYGPTQNPRPAGDARSSLDDYGQFLRMIVNRGGLDGKRILSEASVIEMHRDQTVGSSIVYTIFGDKAHLDPKLPASTYGIGMWRESQQENGEILAASSPGALGSYPWIDFRRGVGGIMLTNSSFSRSLPVYLRLKKEVQEIVDRVTIVSN